MGLFARLFKKQPDKAREKVVESGSVVEAAPGPAAFLQPKESAPREMAPVRPSPSYRAEVANPAIGQKREIVLTFGDVQGRIPAQFLRSETLDTRRELRFAADEFNAEIARGRVTVALSRIAAQCPDLFRAPIEPADDVEVRLPLQKLLDQLSHPSPHPFPAAVSGNSAEPPVAPPPPKAAMVVPLLNAVESLRPPAPEPTAAVESDTRTIELSLAALVAGCPVEALIGERPRVEDGVRVLLPFAPIESQLASGRVEITAQRFIALLPAKYAACFQGREGVKIPVPLEEIFRNLPGPAAQEPPATPPQAELSQPAAELSPAQRPSAKPPTVELPSAAPAEPEVEVISEEAAVATSAPTPEFTVTEIAAAALVAPQITAPPQFHFFSPAPPTPQPISLPVIPAVPEEAKEDAAGDAVPLLKVEDGLAALRSPDPTPAAPEPETAPPDRATGGPPVIREPDEIPPASFPPATPRPTLAPPLRHIELHASPDALSSVQSGPNVLQVANTEPAPVDHAEPMLGVATPPPVRPLAIVPPPLREAVTAPREAGQNLPASEDGDVLETTADQTAVLEFLSETLTDSPAKDPSQTT
jgi:hypothetical protein